MINHVNLKKWRPQSLSNAVYKIVSGSIANFKKVLKKLIGVDQTGYISGIYIGENSKTIYMYDTMHYTEINNILGSLLLIDFEKAFYTVSCTFIKQVLRQNNFSPDIQKWVTLFQNNIHLVVNRDGTYQIKFIYTVAVDKGTLYHIIFLFNVLKCLPVGLDKMIK